MLALIIAGIAIAVAGAFTLFRSGSVVAWNERGSAKIGRAMGIDNREERDMSGQKGWAKAAGAIILLAGLALVVAGIVAT